MGSNNTLLDVLRALPVDARAAVFGESFSRRFAGCRLACLELQQLHDSAITHVHIRLGPQQQDGAGTVPVATFRRCSSLSIEVAGAADQLVVALAGIVAEVRQRITDLSISGWGCDRLAVAEAVVAQLPSLEVLELSVDDSCYSDRTARSQPRGSIFSVLAAGMPGLRRLTLPHATNADLTGLGALAGCPQLRELALPRLGSSGSTAVAGTAEQAVLEGLAQLQQLERLALGSSIFVREDGRQLLTALLSSRRPPQLRTLVLLGTYDAPVAEVGFAPGIGAKGSEAAGWVMACVQLFMDRSRAIQPQMLVPALLAAADSLLQLTIPKLSVVGAWELARDKMQPGADLPRLLARCERVEVDRLPSVDASDRYSMPGPPGVLLSAARLLGLPRELELQHGTWLCRDAVLNGATGAAVAAASTRGGGRQELAHRLQQLHLGASSCASSASARPPLHLDTASAEDVLGEAVERLWAEAASGAEAAAGGCAAAGGRKSSSDGDGSGSEEGYYERWPPVLLLVRGTLPPAPTSSGPFADYEVDDEDWQGWLEDALNSCFAAAGPQPLTPAQEPCEGRPRLPDSVYQCFHEGVHVAAPGAGVLLLDCGSEAGAAELAALVPEAFSAVMVSPDVGVSPEGALTSQVFQVLMELWVRSRTTPANDGGEGGDRGGGGSSSGTLQPAASPAAPRGSSRVSEEVLGPLQRLLDLDRDARKLWAEVSLDDYEEDYNYDDYDCVGSSSSYW